MEETVIALSKQMLFLHPTDRIVETQMLKQVQHDNRIGFSSFCHPELGSGSRFRVLKPRRVAGFFTLVKKIGVSYYLLLNLSGIR